MFVFHIATLNRHFRRLSRGYAVPEFTDIVVRFISHCTRLTHLTLHSTHLGDLSEDLVTLIFVKLKNLTAVRLEGDELTYVAVKTICSASASSLTELDLAQTYLKVSTGLVNAIQPTLMSALTHLHVRTCEVEDYTYTDIDQNSAFALLNK